MTLFLRCVLERYDVICNVCATRKKKRFGDSASLQPTDPRFAHFLEHPNDCLSTFCDTRGSNVPAILRDWQGSDAERAVSLSSFHKKKSKGERSGEHGG